MHATVGTEQRGPSELERPDRVQRVDRGTDTRSRYGSCHEEQQRGSGFPRGGLRYGGERGVLD